MSAPIVLPADIYDALELSALAYGGIGRGRFVEPRSMNLPFEYAPVCVIGHARWVDPTRRVERTMRHAGIDTQFNDYRIIPSSTEGRISWSEYFRRANIVRGES